MKRVLPPGLSEQTFINALSEFEKIVGKQWVFSGQDDADSYDDPYSPFERKDDFHASAAIAPDNVQQVQEIVKIANRYAIPLWTVATGKNLAYGGAAPRLSGSVVLDLKRMNRILEVNEELGYALVEPGVSYFDLYQYIQERGLKLWMSVPSPGWGSVLGNALERGIGYTPYGDHFGKQCGMEVVLADGELIRTGTGSLPDTDSWQQFKYGFGPYIDGLFTQSNLGVVTKMGIWLMPEPQSFMSCMINIPKEEDLEATIDILRPLMMAGVIQCMPSIYVGTFEASFRTVRSKYHPHPTPMSKVQLKKMYDDLGLGWWNLRLSFYGLDKMVEASWEAVRDAFAKIPGVKFNVHRFTTPLEPGKLDYNDKIQAGIPSLAEWTTINWVPGVGGHIDFSPMCPLLGATAMKQYRLFADLLSQYGFEYLGGFIGRERGLVQICPLPIFKSIPQVTEKVRELFSLLVTEAAKNGWGEYRAHLGYMDLVADTYSYNNHSLMRFNERIKDALDPNGILSPGKQGIWPKNLRGNRS